MNRARLEELLASVARLRLLVIGDYFLDLYLDIDRTLAETSIETGLEAHQVAARRPSPGAAGNVAGNARSLGAQVVALGPLGDDGDGYDLRRTLQAQGIETGALLTDAALVTPTYIKPLLREADGRVHELSRLDIKNRQPLPTHVQAGLLARLADLAQGMDGIIVNDQAPETNCGAITDRVRDGLATLAAARPDLPIVVDSRQRLGLFRQMALKPNEHEALAALGWPDTPERERIQAAGQALAQRAARPVFCTLGARGTLVCTASSAELVPAAPVSGEIDTVGAGDTALAAITAGLAAGATPYEAALMGNLAAAVTIKCLGTTGVARPAEILAAHEALERRS
jgi:rfaE bifunctional protein kinase chain/domain